MTSVPASTRCRATRRPSGSEGRGADRAYAARSSRSVPPSSTSWSSGWANCTPRSKPREARPIANGWPKRSANVEKHVGMPGDEFVERLCRAAPGGRAAAGSQAHADRGQPAAGRLDRQEVPESRPVVAGPDPGREHRPDEGGRPLPVPPRLQVLDVRDVVDPPGDRARHRRLRPHHPPAGPRRRLARASRAHTEEDARDAGPRSKREGAGAGARHAGRESAPAARGVTRSRCRSMRRRTRAPTTTCSSADG